MPLIGTFGYPLFLYCCLKIWPSFTFVLLIQHSFILLTGLTAGILYYRFLDRNLLRSTLVFFFTALLPRGVVYAHSIMSESPYCFLLILALMIFLYAVHYDRSWLWLLLGTVLFIGMALRPVGISNLAAIALSIPLYLKGARQMRAYLLMFLSIGVLSGIVHWKLPERAAGVRELAALEIFGMTAPWLDLEQIDDPVAKATLSPLFSQNPDKITDANWVRGIPYLSLRTAKGLRRPVPQTLSHLAWLAIRSHPWQIFWAQVRTAGEFIFLYSRRPQNLHSKDFSVAFGLNFYGQFLKDYPQAISLIFYRPQTQERYFEKIRQSKIYPYEPGGLFSTPIFPWVFIIGFIPPVALVAAAVLLWTKTYWRTAWIFLWVIFFHVLLNGLIHGNDGRFALPLEPLYLMLVMTPFSVDAWRRKATAWMRQNRAKKP